MRPTKKYLLLAGLVSLLLLYYYISSYQSNKKMVEAMRQEILVSLPIGVRLVSYEETIGLTGGIKAKYILDEGDDPLVVVKKYCQYFLDQRGWYHSSFLGMDCNELIRNSEGTYKLNFCYSTNDSIGIYIGQQKGANYDLFISFFSRGSSLGGC